MRSVCLSADKLWLCGSLLATLLKTINITIETYFGSKFRRIVNSEDMSEASHEIKYLSGNLIQSSILSTEGHMASKIILRGVRSVQKSNRNTNLLITSTVYL